jgi:DNA transformation protein
MLYGLEGAVQGIRDTLLSDEAKKDLKNFYKNL